MTSWLSRGDDASLCVLFSGVLDDDLLLFEDDLLVILCDLLSEVLDDVPRGLLSKVDDELLLFEDDLLLDVL